ncbi:Xaa-Pro dipeptidase [Rubripirellula amarantea]|uniref:Xaa-Pro dipeptidase n=1 Tax=Rubripirellula amarantea TaxID=2527999 RepID=A0A5C5WKZ2_9BACT|nr:M24 family metallopeptidase [Rubripirellula amarantea]TWT50721.1 Xaa-Pro dipeptidase [Rubripirellula amarantea]
MKINRAHIMAGYASHNASLFRRLGVSLGDPAAWIKLDERAIALVRDLEMDRVRAHSRADKVTCPAENSPPAGLSPDRETATAEAAVQILRGAKIEEVTTDRTLPFIFAWHLQQAEIIIRYDPNYGVIDRRTKTDAEIMALRQAQAHTESVMRMVCERIARSDTNDQGQLVHDGEVLTSEGLRKFAAVEFMQLGCSMSHGGIVATVPQVADCHHSGTGPLVTGHPVVVDLFPRDDASGYWGDCTRTVVHGTPTDEVIKMHAAVIEAKQAAIDSLVGGNTADRVHRASESVLKRHGYKPSRGKITDEPSIQHGTGHGVGLELHEPILLDAEGGEILEGEVFTVEPGLYGRTDGGVRVEDMLVVTDGEPVNLNTLPEGLDWA